MKTPAQLIRHVLLASLLMAGSMLNAQATGTEPGDSVRKERSFEVGIFMGPQWHINLMLAIHRPEHIVVTLRGANNAILHREYLRRTPISYRLKFNFAEAEPGVYQFEVSDNQHTIVRQVEVVKMPAVESQRYITYSPQLEF